MLCDDDDDDAFPPVRTSSFFSQTLASSLLSLNQTLASGGTDNHLLLWDARPLSLTGAKLSFALECCAMTANKNSLPGDKSAVSPGGVRIGTPAITSRGMNEDDMETVARFLGAAAEVARDVERECKEEQSRGGTGNDKVALKTFCEKIKGDKRIEEIRQKVVDFSDQFYMPGEDM